MLALKKLIILGIMAVPLFPFSGFAGIINISLDRTPPDDPNITLSYSGGPLIAPATIGIDFNFQGFQTFKFLRVQSMGDGYRKLKLGYNRDRLFGDIIDVNFDFVEIVLKDFSGTANWSKIEFRPNEKSNVRVNLGGYISAAEVLADGWIKLRIPLSAWGTDRQEFGRLKYMAFPYSFNAGAFDLGIKEIRFIGENRSFEWLGPLKNDNAHDGSGVGAALLATRVTDGDVAIDKVEVMNVGDGMKKQKLQMPYAIPFTLAAGQHHFVAKVMDGMGNFYYSDTLNLTVTKGISFAITHVDCHGFANGEIDASVDGGTPPYTFSWSNGAGAEDISGLAAGVYSLFVEDAVGNAFSRTAEIMEPMPLEVNVEKIGADSVDINIYGGQSPYSFQVGGNDPETLSDEIEKVRAEIEIAERDGNRFLDIISDVEGNIYFSGEISSTIHLGDSAIGNENQPGIFIAKLNRLNRLEWSAYFQKGSLLDYNIAELAIDQNSNLYAGSTHLFKFNENGSYVWHKPLEGDGNRTIIGIGIDAESNIYVVHSELESRAFVLQKFNADGALIWYNSLTGKCHDMAVSDNGDVFLTGSFNGTGIFGHQVLSGVGGDDMFVIKVTKDGQVEWANRGGGNFTDRGEAITLNGSGEVIVSFLSISTSSVFQSENFSGRHMSLLSLDADDGSLSWSKTFCRWSSPYAFTGVQDLVTDNDNNIYISGESFEPIRTGIIDDDHPGVYLAKLDPMGNGLFIESQRLGLYLFNKGMPLTAYRNGIVNARHDSDNMLIIKEFGSESHQKIFIPTETCSITITDANNCSEEFNFQENSTSTEICYVTVANPDGVQIFLSGSGEGIICQVYRETSRLDEYELIGTTQAGEESFTDNSANPLVRSYRYRLKSIDFCGDESDFSTPHKTMHLTVNEGNKSQINLIWDRYEGFDYSGFQIYRGTTPGTMEFLTEVPSNLFTYTDYNPSPSTLYYQITVEGEGDCASESGSSANGRKAGNRVVQSNVANKFGQLGGLTLYPNPASDKINIRFNPDGNVYNLSMIDMKGRVVRRQENVFDHGTVLTDNLPAGIYTIIVTDEKGNRLKGNVMVK